MEKWHLPRLELSDPPEERDYYKIRTPHILEFGHHIGQAEKHADIRLLLTTAPQESNTTEGLQVYECDVMFLNLSDSPTFYPNNPELNDINYEKYSICVRLNLHELFVNQTYYKNVMEKDLNENKIIMSKLDNKNEKAPSRTR